jgi:hypothetical protein
MSKILTAEEFLTLVLAKIRLMAPEAELDTVDIDRQFEEAYELLSKAEGFLDVTPNFTFNRDPLYGNTAKLRDALLSLRERRMVQADPAKPVYRIKLSEELARAYMARGVLAEDFLDTLVIKTFPELVAPATA